MRVLLVHNFYGSSAPSGENQAVEAERTLLEYAGAQVIPFFVSSDGVRSRGMAGQLEAALATPWNPAASNRIAAVIEKTKPDVVHAHNLFPLLSPSVLWTASRAGRTVVVTVHNYRMFCAAATLTRDCGPCMDCLKRRSVVPALIHRCYRDSVAATAPIALNIALHRGMGTWRRTVDAWIALSKLQRGHLIEQGFDESRIFIKPNSFPNAPAPRPWSEREEKVIFLGRITAEKGVRDLILGWAQLGQDAPALQVIGDGPLRKQLAEEVARSGIKQVTFGGMKSHAESLLALSTAKLLIIPSTALEGYPMVLREALALGVPIAATNHGAIASILEDGKQGFLFPPNAPSSIASLVADLFASPGKLQAASVEARRLYETELEPKHNAEMLMSIYDHAIRSRRERSGK